MTTVARSSMIRVALLITLLSLAGCFSLSRQAPPQQHYVLGAGEARERAALLADPVTEDSTGDVIGLRPPRLADYLATPFIVVRRGGHRVEFSEYHRWGEDVGRAINRTVAGRLAARTQHHRIEVAPWPVGISPDRMIQLQILHFEGLATEPPGDTEGRAHLLATWEILRAGDGAVLARGTTDVTEEGWTVGDFDGLVNLLDAALDVLADDLARALQRAPAP
ncbi:MAG: membrane integrity-associated transporter subunit PqiC [Gemmatimonadales bacterium]|nr:MAG: membrane integrity-associated transporter subunit PqiC [Gemmatimonadales bacterium]